MAGYPLGSGRIAGDGSGIHFGIQEYADLQPELGSPSDLWCDHQQQPQFGDLGAGFHKNGR
ncbi:hypothetical protein D9M71_789820 [compost metagenome]